jgi:predicted AlkP superfamily pyrophosphatase or phosphodiesterase
VTWNGDLAAAEQVYPAVPTIFDLAKKGGMTTGLAAGKTKFLTLARPGSVDYLWLPEVSTDDNQLVAEAAGEIIRRYRPNVMFVHFASVDIVGHAIGWGTPEQVAAVEDADVAVGTVVKAVTEAGLWGQALLIVTADHGGQGRGHGANDARSRHIPWIVVGPNVRVDYDLTRFGGLVINTEDTFATSLYFLGLPVPGGISGKPVLEVLEERELLQ